MALSEIAYLMVLGRPLVLWLGWGAVVLVLASTAIGFLTLKGKFKLKHHQWLAYLTVFFALAHGLLNWLT